MLIYFAYLYRRKQCSCLVSFIFTFDNINLKFFFLIFILEYSWFTMLCQFSGVQKSDTEYGLLCFLSWHSVMKLIARVLVKCLLEFMLMAFLKLFLLNRWLVPQCLLASEARCGKHLRRAGLFLRSLRSLFFFCTVAIRPADDSRARHMGEGTRSSGTVLALEQ